MLMALHRNVSYLSKDVRRGIPVHAYSQSSAQLNRKSRPSSKT